MNSAVRFKRNNMKAFKYVFSILFIFLSMLTPQVVTAQTNNCNDGLFKPLVVCGRNTATACAGTTNPCKLSDLVTVFGNIVINIIILLLIISPLYIMYIGIQMIINHGIPKKMVELKQKLLLSILYLIVIFGSWLIVNEIVKVFNISSDVPSFLLDKNGAPISNPGPSIH